MYFILMAIVVFLLSGLLSVLGDGRGNMAAVIGVFGSILGGFMALVPAVVTLCGGAVEPIRWAWSMPMGSFAIAMDGLSALFMLPIAVLPALAAVYGGAYLASYRERRSLGASWFFYNLLAASMVLLTVARNGVLFLVAWETMSLASFFLVTFENERETVRRAGWTYLVATHMGTAFLLVMFLMLARENNSLDYERFTANGAPGVVFVLALVGFGTKAGFLPFHVWLPEAHPAAPSHVSAVMSGVMIKTGIYGLLRLVTFLGPPMVWWGWLLVGVGAISGVFGVLLALAQHDLKRLLAYHSVENVGIIAMGLGLGIVGLAHENLPIAVLGFAGGLLHVINHAVFKALLFLGAGSVQHATGTREIDHLGGLIKKMPWTAATFLVGAAAISALPPLNGFASEFLIYLGAFRSVVSLAGFGSIAALVVIASLALIGGLAAACFTKAFGVVFLGEARSEHCAHAHEAPRAMVIPMVLLAATCAIIGIVGPLVVVGLAPAVAVIAGVSPAMAGVQMAETSQPLSSVVLGAAGLVIVLVALALARRWMLNGRRVGTAPTWDCGYAAPNARMQYTASSFAQPLTDLFRLFLRTRVALVRPEGPLPGGASLETHTPDIFRDGLYRPAFGGALWLMSRLRWLQHGRLQLYVLYIVAALLVLLVWKVG